MSNAYQAGLVWLLSLFFGAIGCALAQDALLVDPATPLVTLKVPGTGYANMRALPDPRSATVLQLPAGTASIKATGVVKLYGDTWWVELQSGTITGWLNARLLGRGPGSTPLQAFVNIDALQPIADYSWSSESYRAMTVTSFDECARTCVGDDKCAAIEHRNASAQCRLFEQRGDAIKQLGAEIAAKPAKSPAGGWAVQSAVRFDRLAEQGADADGYRAVVAHSTDECAATCGLDAKCAAFGYQRKKRICTAYERLEKMTLHAGIDTGIRRAAPPLVDVAPVATVALPLPTSRSAQTKDSLADTRPVAEIFQQVFAAAGQGSTKAAAEVHRQGRVTFTLIEVPLGDAMHVAALPRVLDGTFLNLAAVVGLTDPRVVHLVYYAGVGSPPVVLASSSYASAEEAHTAALKLQNDVDGLAKMSGLSTDPLSLLKPLRR